MTEQDELLNDFLVETKENLDHLDEELLALESSPEDSELINAIFRRLHTVKGVCGFLELKKLESVSHAGETLLGALRANELKVTDHIVTLLLTLCDAIRTIVRCIEETKGEGTQSFDQLAADLLAAAKPPQDGAVAPAKELTLDEEFAMILAQREAEESQSVAAAPPPPAPAAVVAEPSGEAKHALKLQLSSPKPLVEPHHRKLRCGSMCSSSII
jgi:two-component system chemotaxis sensor kinase CheA